MLTFPAIGCWKHDQVFTTWGQSSRPVIPEVEQAIDRTWAQWMAKPGINLFDGPMCRMESFEASADRLQLNLSPTSYKTFFGTNMHNAALADQYGQPVLANAVGLSALLVSGDGHALMGRRNQSVAYYPGHVHPFAGALEPGERIDVFDEILREFNEELSLAAGDFEAMFCTGIARDRSLRQPELMFLARARPTRSEIESRLDPTEHRGVWTIPATADSAAAALKSGERFTPVGVAAILLWGRVDFGEPWFVENRRNFVRDTAF